MQHQISNETLKTAHQALIAELARREEEAQQIRAMAIAHPQDECWGRFLEVNRAIVTNVKAASVEISTALFGQTWDEVSLQVEANTQGLYAMFAELDEVAQ
jgi:hypothetical protein